MKYTPDFSSRFRILKGGKISLVVSAFLAGSTMSFAAPSGGSVTSGSATINQNGSITTINQSTNKASINWQDFSIGKTETVNFVQPSAQSVTLNRVVGTTQSLIEGAMNANGQVFLLNPNGVLFANGAQVNVGGLVASTLNLSDANFQAGNYTFEGNSQNSIINMGTITANNGYVAMMGKHVANEGTIVATMGNVQLASGEKISLNLNGNSLVKLTIDQGTMDALVENKGLIKADGGQVYLTTQALNTILDGMVNNTGIIEAQTLNDITGKVILFAHGGTANIGGTIKAEGGFVETSGKEFTIQPNATIKAKDWLLDPTNITISSAGADGIGGSNISGATIAGILNNGTNITLQADIDMTIADIIAKTAGGDATLTLIAGNNILFADYLYIDNVRTASSITSTMGKLGISLTAGGSIVLNGDYEGTNTTPHNQITTNGGNFVANSSKGFHINQTDISTGTGDLTLRNSGTSSTSRGSAIQSSILSGGSVSIFSESGNTVNVSPDGFTTGLFIDHATIDATSSLSLYGSTGHSGYTGLTFYGSSTLGASSRQLTISAQSTDTAAIYFTNASSSLGGSNLSYLFFYANGHAVNQNTIRYATDAAPIITASTNAQISLGSSDLSQNVYINSLPSGAGREFVFYDTGAAGENYLGTGGIFSNFRYVSFGSNYSTADVYVESLSCLDPTTLFIQNGATGTIFARGDWNAKVNVYTNGGGVTLTSDMQWFKDVVMLTRGGTISAASHALDAYGMVDLYSGAGDILLNGYDTNFRGKVTASGHTISLKDSVGGLLLGNITATGNVTLDAGYSTIRQAVNTSLDITGDLTIPNAFSPSNSDSGYTYLNNTTNRVTGVIGYTGSAFELKNNRATQLGNIDTLGLTLVSAGDVTQAANTSIITVGNTYITAFDGMVDHDIILENSSNAFGSLYINGRNASFVSNGVIGLGNITLSGDLSLTATDSILQELRTSIITRPTSTVTLSAPNMIMLTSGMLTDTSDDPDEPFYEYAPQNNEIYNLRVLGNGVALVGTSQDVNLLNSQARDLWVVSDKGINVTGTVALTEYLGRIMLAANAEEEYNVVFGPNGRLSMGSDNNKYIIYSYAPDASHTSQSIGAPVEERDYVRHRNIFLETMFDPDAGSYFNYTSPTNVLRYEVDQPENNDYTPAPTSSSQHEQDVEDVITTIVNQTTVTSPTRIKIEEYHQEEHHEEEHEERHETRLAQTQTKNMLKQILPHEHTEENYNLVGMTDGKNATQTVTMEQLQKAVSGQGVGEVRVPLGNGSVVELVNGGLNLPKGVSQEFYVVATNRTGTAAGTTSTNGNVDTNANNKKVKKN